MGLDHRESENWEKTEWTAEVKKKKKKLQFPKWPLEADSKSHKDLIKKQNCHFNKPGTGTGLAI